MLNEIKFYSLAIFCLIFLFFLLPFPSFSSTDFSMDSSMELNLGEEKVISGMKVEKGRTHVLVNKKVNYMITDRSFKTISEIYGFSDKENEFIQEDNGYKDTPDFFINKKLKNCFKNKKVLDLASGGGSLVKFLNDRKVKAYGVDLIPPNPLNQKKVKKSYFKNKGENDAYFSILQASMTDLPFKDLSFDRMISSFGPFTYFDGKLLEQNKEEQLKVILYSLQEIQRVLSPGGMALIGPMAETYYGDPLPLNIFQYVEDKIKDINAGRAHDDKKNNFLKSYRGLGRPTFHCVYCPYLIIVKGNNEPSSFCSKK